MAAPKPHVHTTPVPAPEPTPYAEPPMGVWTESPARRLVWALEALDHRLNVEPQETAAIRRGQFRLGDALASPVKDFNWQGWAMRVAKDHPEVAQKATGAPRTVWIAKDGVGALSGGDMASGGLLAPDQTSRLRVLPSSGDDELFQELRALWREIAKHASHDQSTHGNRDRTHEVDVSGPVRGTAAERRRWSSAGGDREWTDSRGRRYVFDFIPADRIRDARVLVRVAPDEALPNEDPAYRHEGRDVVGDIQWTSFDWAGPGSSPINEISGVSVHPEYRRAGLATEMLRRARLVHPDIRHSSPSERTDMGDAWAQVAKHGDHDQKTHGNRDGLGASDPPSGTVRLGVADLADIRGHDMRRAIHITDGWRGPSGRSTSSVLVASDGAIYGPAPETFPDHPSLFDAMGLDRNHKLVEQRIVDVSPVLDRWRVWGRPTDATLRTLEDLGPKMRSHDPSWEVYDLDRDGQHIRTAAEGRGIDELRVFLSGESARGAFYKTWIAKADEDDLPPDVLREIEIVADQLAEQTRGGTEAQVLGLRRQALANLMAMQRLDFPPAALDAAVRTNFDLVRGITDTTRTMLRDLLVQTFRDARAYVPGRGMPSATQFDFARRMRQKWEGLSRERAELIAVTEYNSAASTATRESYEAMGIRQVRWMTVGRGSTTPPCPICLGNAAVGEIATGASFPSGHENPPAHPRCRCSLSSA